MKNAEIKNKVKEMVKSDFGKSFTQLKKDIMSTIGKNSSVSDFFKSKNGYSIFYTSNTNYMQGIKNGGGKGFYASINFVGMSKTVKL